MTGPRITPLEDWIRRRIGLRSGAPLTRPVLEAYQLARLRETVACVRVRNPFYRERFKALPEGFPHRLADMAQAPFATADDLRQDPMAFLCVSQSQVARAVTLRTSGTTDRPKRLFFTEADLERTIDFFHHGMSTLVKPGWRVLILMPGELPGSVGDLLVKGLARMDVTGIVHGLVTDPEKTLRKIVDFEIDSLVGLPVQVLGLARNDGAARLPAGRIKSVLLSADYVPDAVVSAIGKAWGCPVFSHYGMTETGLGGGVECEALEGYHLREADLLFEIIDSETGQPAAHDAPGEVVITTLTREAMPLVRYRTDDLAAWLSGACPCGSVLRRMGKVSGRRASDIRLGDDTRLHLPTLDEAVFAVDGVLDYRVEIRSANGRAHVWFAVNAASREALAEVYLALSGVPDLKRLSDAGRMTVCFQNGDSLPVAPSTAVKRRVFDLRNQLRKEADGL